MLINNGCRSQPALDDFQNENAARRMKASSLPDESYQHGDTSIYEELGRGQISLMKEKRQKMYSRLLRKCGVVEDLLYSSRNMIAIKEEMLNDMFKPLMSLHREYGAMLSEEEQMQGIF